VKREVVRHRDDERAGRSPEVVETCPVQEGGVDGEVDGVPARPDRAELRELNPVVPLPKGSARAQAHGRGVGGGTLHRGARVADRPVAGRFLPHREAAETRGGATRTSAPGRTRSSPVGPATTSPRRPPAPPTT